MSAPRIILDSLLPFCQKIPELVEIGRNSAKTKSAQFFSESRCRVPCSNAAKTRNPLTLAGVPQTTGSISAASESLAAEIDQAEVYHIVETCGGDIAA